MIIWQVRVLGLKVGGSDLIHFLEERNQSESKLLRLSHLYCLLVETRGTVSFCKSVDRHSCQLMQDILIALVYLRLIYKLLMHFH